MSSAIKATSAASSVGAAGAHGDAQIGRGEGGGVVDAVADHRDRAVALAELPATDRARAAPRLEDPPPTAPAREPSGTGQRR
jgi:hypothetical protein